VGGLEWGLDSQPFPRECPITPNRAQVTFRGRGAV